MDSQPVQGLERGRAQEGADNSVCIFIFVAPEVEMPRYRHCKDEAGHGICILCIRQPEVKLVNPYNISP